MSTDIKVTLYSADAGKLDATDFSWFVSPVESPDGVNKVFTLPNSESYRSGKIVAIRDNFILTSGVDFTETNPTSITLTIAPDSDEPIKLFYLKA